MAEQSFAGKWMSGVGIILLFLLYPLPTVYHYTITQYYGRESVDSMYKAIDEYDLKYYEMEPDEARMENRGDPIIKAYEEARLHYDDATLFAIITLVLIIILPKPLKILIYLITFPYFIDVVIPWFYN